MNSRYTEESIMGTLILYIGPMYSSKSTSLLREIERREAIGYSSVLLSHSFDTRYGEGVVSTHSAKKRDCISVDNLCSLITPEFNDTLFRARVVGIDESQFFGEADLYRFVKEMITYGKTIVVAGLDADANQQPFRGVLNLIPLCDKVKKLRALCSMCEDGRKAPFTIKISGDIDERIDIGGVDKYKAVCRKCLGKFKR